MEDIDRDIEKYLEMSLDSTQRSCQQLESSDKLAEQTARVRLIFESFLESKTIFFALVCHKIDPRTSMSVLCIARVRARDVWGKMQSESQSI